LLMSSMKVKLSSQLRSSLPMPQLRPQHTSQLQLQHLPPPLHQPQLLHMPLLQLLLLTDQPLLQLELIDQLQPLILVQTKMFIYLFNISIQSKINCHWMIQPNLCFLI
jgi:hypothetical protein